MDTDTDTLAVLEVFAHYGFRRASMDDLARAMGVSRQTLYNRFGTKEAVLNWAVETVTSQSLDRALLALADTDLPLDEAIRAAFARWEGDHVALLTSAPHSSEILELGMAAYKTFESDPRAAFRTALAATVLERGAVPGPAEAEEAAFALTTAAKGLLLTAENAEGFDTGMARIVAAVLRRP